MQTQFPVPENSEILSRPSAIDFLTKGLQPPSNLYVTLLDQLQITIFPFASPTVTIHARLLKPDGQITVLEQTCVPPQGNTPNPLTIPLAEGFLLSCTASVDALPTQNAPTYITVTLVRGRANNQAIATVLLSGYIWFRQPLSWPTSPPRVALDYPGIPFMETIINPAAGANFTITGSATWRRKIIAIMATFTCDANVAGRSIILNFNVTLNTVFTSRSNFTQAAGSQVIYCFSSNPLAQLAGVEYRQIPSDLMNSTTQDTIVSAVGAIQVGDQWSGITVYSYVWLTPNQ